MSDVIIYNPESTIVANIVTTYLMSVNTPDYLEDPYAIINPNLSNVVSVDPKYWKVDTGDVVEMSQGEKDLVDASLVSPNYMASESQEEIVITNNTDYEEVFYYEPKLSSGIYNVMWSAEVASDSTSGKVKWECKIDDSIIKNSGIFKTDSADEFLSINGAFDYEVLTESIVKFSLNIATSKSTSAAKIRNILITVRRKGI